MSNNNYGNQQGDRGINVGVGDFRGSNVQVGDNGKPTFTPEQLEIVRHPAFGGRRIKSENLSTFSIVTGLASVIGLYFTVFQGFPQAKHSSWSTFFMFGFIVAVTSLLIPIVLKKKKFKHFLFRKYYLESGTYGGIYMNSFTAKCPWCGSRMKLRNIGPKDGPRDDLFVCERNPKQHTVSLDPTVLSDIEEHDF